MKFYKILKEGEEILSEIPGRYAGWKGDKKSRKIFGRLACESGTRMKKENRVFFHAIKDAINQGYRPCKKCRPMDEEDWQEIKHLVPEKSLEEFYNRGL